MIDREPTRDDLLVVAAFSEPFSRPDFEPGCWKYTGDGALYFDRAPKLGEFVMALHDRGVVLHGFDWPAWTEGERYVDDPTLVGGADLETIRKLLTAHVRSERFSEGHLAAMVRSGHLGAVLRRLKAVA